MRLTCPNCDARYEIEDDLIPPEGRDVQCSECGHVWFQQAQEPEPGAAAQDMPDAVMDVAPEGDPEAPAEAGETTDPVLPDPEPEVATTPTQPPEPAAATAPAEPPADDAPQPVEDNALPPQDEGDPVDEDEAAPGGPDVPRPAIDETLRRILSEEAEREAKARADEAARAATRGLETQPDLGLPETDGGTGLRIRPRKEPVEYLSEPDDDPFAEADTGSGRAARRGLLPDIDQINSTLSASSARAAGEGVVPDPALPERQRSGFRLGFGLAILVGILLMTLYMQAPRLAEAFPALGSVLNAYVAVIDTLRLGLDMLVKALLNWLQSEG